MVTSSRLVLEKRPTQYWSLEIGEVYPSTVNIELVALKVSPI